MLMYQNERHTNCYITYAIQPERNGKQRPIIRGNMDVTIFSRNYWS